MLRKAVPTWAPKAQPSPPITTSNHLRPPILCRRDFDIVEKKNCRIVTETTEKRGCISAKTWLLDGGEQLKANQPIFTRSSMAKTATTVPFHFGREEAKR